MAFGASSMFRRYGRRAALRRSALGIGIFLSVRPAGARAAQPAGEVRLLILGDSITAGYGLAPEEAFPAQLQRLLREAGEAVRVIPAGVSGDTTAGGRARLDWALADRPQAVIVALGGNDGLRGLPPADSHANLDDILNRLKARGLPTLLAGMLAPPNLGADYGRDFAATFTRLAEAHPEAVFYPFLLEGVAGEPALNQPDRIHPNARGAAEMARRMLPAVRELLSKVQGG
ncbi:arylesterase [Pseudoroseomonas rhizosphaerae]|uniref:Arylesterase n=1 Tax=Teichococcus rhizosphaerae TaxID=1335062 RepID=A0A2C6Y5V7_9PROT|nr:arylesterase [Pseudoroseomonas rhizosphaerae]PHK96202.1 arylesterase [Pseudoroseomonas rhizosphaerae]